jgi:DDE superfamily endonuclease
VRRPEEEAVAVVSTVARDLVVGAGLGDDDAVSDTALAVLSGFRRDFYGGLTARADELFELAEAVLCTDGPVQTLVGLSLAPEHRRGHGALYGALNRGRIEIGRLAWAVAALPPPRAAGGRIVLAVDVSPWLRPDAATSPQRLFCHTYGRAAGAHEMIPGWPYSIVAALETGATSWTRVLDALRLGPADDVTAVTAGQVRQVVMRLIGAGHWRPGDADILICFDAGYDSARMAFLLGDLPVQVLGRLRSDRVFYQAAPTRRCATTGRPLKHGPPFRFTDPATWPTPDITTTSDTTRYGTAVAAAWNRLHPLLVRRSAWAGHAADLPVIDGTVIRLQVERLPGDHHPTPIWLWTSATNLPPDQINRLWQAYLRRFDLEHTFRLFKQTLGWTTPKIRTPQAADRWTWIIIAVHTQLYLARHLTKDLRRPWERPAPPGRLTPARVRRGFRNLRPKLTRPASAPKPGKPGPGRPPGSKNRRPAPRYNVGKTTKQDTPPKNGPERTG